MLQALWSMAREGTDVTVVVCANRSYRVLQIELARAGIAQPGLKAQSLTDLSRPVIDWVALLPKIRGCMKATSWPGWISSRQSPGRRSGFHATSHRCPSGSWK
jgi:hypothetical protein